MVMTMFEGSKETTDFRSFLQQEIEARMNRNPNYSLRSFSKQVGVDHSTLSKIIRGKRKITSYSIRKMGLALGLDLDLIEHFCQTHCKEHKTEFQDLEIDKFYAVAEWYHDAILELTRTKDFQPNPQWVAQRLGLNIHQVRAAVDRLQRLGLLQCDEGQWLDASGDNTVILDNDYTSEVLKKYQLDILNKSIESFDETPKKWRNHTSMMVTVKKSDFPQILETIARFRKEMAQFTQRDPRPSDELYAMQVSLFPISKVKEDSQK